MRMIGYQRPTKTKGLGVGDNVIQSVNEIFPVGIIIKNFPTLDSSNNDMLQGTGCIDSGLAWHNSFIPQKPKNIKLYFYGRPLDFPDPSESQTKIQPQIKETISSDPWQDYEIVKFKDLTPSFLC